MRQTFPSRASQKDFCPKPLIPVSAQLVPIGILIVCWNLGKYIVDIVLFIVFCLYCFLYSDYHDHTMTFLLSPIVILLIILICQDDTINHVANLLMHAYEADFSFKGFSKRFLPKTFNSSFSL
jgi:hypothetical protein